MRIIRKNYLLLGLCILGFIPLLTAQFNPATPLSGKEQTKDYIKQQLLYPQEALDAGRSGLVVVAFRLDEEGNGSDYRIKESFSEAANPQTLDLVKRILWSPAHENGFPVASDMEYAVEYNVKAYKRYWKKRERPTVPLTLEADTSYRIYDHYHLEEAAKPYFADGSSMGRYLLTNLKYPESAKAAEISGTVRLDFVVEPDGSVSNIVVAQSVGGGCDNEAIRLMEATQWIPAVKNGQYVRSRNEQEITFNFGARNYLDGNTY